MPSTRRQFGKMVGAGALALGIGEISMGFSCATVYTDIENYVPIGLAAFNTIITLIDPPLATVLAPVIVLVKAAFADLTAAITEYNNAPAAGKTTLLGKVRLAIQAVIDNLNKFWSDANIPDSPLASMIVGVLQIVVSTLAAFLPLIGGTVASKKVAKEIPIVPRTKKQLAKSVVKSDINAVFVKYGYSANQIH
jgi:hypothetical protein